MSATTIGVIGLGKMGTPMAESLIKNGFRVVGYRRSPTPELERLGMVRAASPAAVGAEADVVLSCLPSLAALEETMAGPQGLLRSARAGQVVAELGSYKIADKDRQRAAFEAKGAKFLDGELSGTPGMFAARKGVVFLAGDKDAAYAIEPVIKGFADNWFYFGAFGAATKVKLINNLLVAVHIAAAAEAMSIALKADIDVPMMVKAIATGSGGSSSFAFRAPWMAERKFTPVQGSPSQLEHYIEEAKALGASVGRATPMLDRAAELYARARTKGLHEQDVAVMLQVLEEMPPAKAKPRAKSGWFGRRSA